MTLKHLRSSTADKRPQASGMAEGQLAINTASGSPGLFFKDSAGNLVKVGPVHVGSGAPNASPASGGTSGNSLGEQWLDTSGGTYVFKIWDGSAWRSEAGEFVNTTGDTMTGALGIIAGSAGSPGLYFSGDTNTGLYSPGADQLALSTNGTGRLFVDASGNVKVGSTDNSNAATQYITVGSVGVTDGGLQLWARTNGQSYVQFGDTTTSADQYRGYLQYSHASDFLALGTASQERLRITSAGLVGVGTSNPQAKLDVASTHAYGITAQDVIRITPDFSGGSPFSASSMGSIIWGYNDGTTNLGRINVVANQPGTTNASSMQFWIHNGSSFAQAATLTPTGLGIGTSSATDLLSVGTLGSSTNATITLGSSTTSSGQIYFGDGTGASRYRGYVQYIHSSDSLILGSAGSDRVTVDSSGRVGIGTTTPSARIESNWNAGNQFRASNGSGTFDILNDSTNSLLISSGPMFYRTGTSNPHIFQRDGGSSEVARIDGSGRLLVGTSSAVGNYGLQVEQNPGADPFTGSILLRRGLSNASIGGAGYSLGTISAGSQTNIGGSILFESDATWGTNDYPTRLVFSTTADGASSPTERMRIDNAGKVFIGKTSRNFDATGVEIVPTGGSHWVANATTCLSFNRLTNDGDLIEFGQGGFIEGTISVSGSTVSYNGAHLSRWSQLPGGVERTEILRGTVLSNIDEMCEWGDEDNEQLNRMKVSDVEGDKNVAGVFQAWDDDDDTYTNDFYCAMTGDFIIRIGAGVTVERGDLLMSAGDGTAKPQDDDIIRSKTIAKVTSTNVSCTYDDGSYCVPCVLMAC